MELLCSANSLAIAFLSGYAAWRARQYSWCSPPRIGVAITSVCSGEAMTVGHDVVACGRRISNARSQAGVWPTAVIVGYPFAKDPSEMSLVDRDQPIQTLPTHCADQSLAERVGLRHPHWGLEHMPPHRRDRPVDRGCVDAVPIVEDEPMGRLGGDDRAKLLDRPLRRGMLRHVPVEDPPRAVPMFARWWPVTGRPSIRSLNER